MLDGKILAHYYYHDHSQQVYHEQNETNERKNVQQSTLTGSSEALDGNYFLLGQSIWFICQLLGRMCARRVR
jgi:hypothetical protein